MAYTIHTEDRGGLRIAVHHDEHADVETFFGDMPLQIYHAGRGGRMHMVHDNSRLNLPRDWLKLIADSESDKLAVLMFEQDADSEDCANGEDSCDGWNEDGHKKFLLRALTLIAHTGAEVADTQSDRYYAFWDKSEMAQWSGRDDTTPDLQTYVDNDVWYYTVDRIDEDGDTVESLESVGGFVGDWEYCKAEAILSAIEILKRETGYVETPQP